MSDADDAAALVDKMGEPADDARAAKLSAVISEQAKELAARSAELAALRAWKREAEPLLEVLRGKLGTESAWTGIDAEWSEQMGELDRLIGSQRV